MEKEKKELMRETASIVEEEEKKGLQRWQDKRGKTFY